jgi:Dna[CI] antecedent, DciA
MLGELLDGARVVSAQRGKVAIDRDSWRRLLGDRVARRTEPGGLAGGVLTIYVASAPWAQELSLLTNELLERLKPLQLRINSVRFRVRQQIQGPAAQQRRRPAARAALPSELKQRVDSIDDPELRQVIADAAELWLGRAERLSAKSTAPNRRSAAARNDRSAKSSAPRGEASPSKPESPKWRRR